MAEQDADMVVILSCEVIEKITQEYFNKTAFKQKVKIVDSKPHGDAGYMFSVAYVVEEKKAAVFDDCGRDIDHKFYLDGQELGNDVMNRMIDENHKRDQMQDVNMQALGKNYPGGSVRAKNGRFVKTFKE